jgi:glycosyltransferase involved in cell wall biosynthesis
VTRPQLVALSWRDVQPRASGLAASLDGEAVFIQEAGWLGTHHVLLPLRYLADAIRTWSQLSRRRPRVVLAATPPVFAPLVAWLWCWWHRAALVMDCHVPGTFDSRRWAWTRPLHRFLARRAVAVLVHARQNEALVKSWGAAALLLLDDIPDVNGVLPAIRTSRPRVIVAGSCDPSEPVGAAVAAAALIPEVEVHITGDANRLAPSLRSNAPANVLFTGYLPYPRFLGALATADVVVVLTEDGHTELPRAAAEAVGLGRPLVLSDVAGLHVNFDGATLFCPNDDPGGVAQTLRRALAEGDLLALRSQRLAAEFRARRAEGIARLKSMLAEYLQPAPRRRVLMISQHPYPANPLVQRNVQYLLSQGLEVDLVTMVSSNFPTWDPGRPPGLHVYRIRLNHRRSPAFWYLVEYLVFFLRALPVVCALGLRHKYAVVQVDNLPDTLVFTAFVPRWRGARVVLVVFDHMPELLAARLGVGDAHLLVRVSRVSEKVAHAWADHIISVSEACRALLLRHGVNPNKVSVLPNSRPPSPGPAWHPDSPPVVLALTSLLERYGVHVLIQATAILREAWPDVIVRIIGQGEFKPQLIELATRLGVLGQVDFRDFLPWQEAMAEARRATLGVVPLIADGYTELMLPTKLLDYVEQGLPAICARLPTIQAYFPEGTVSYFTPGDAAALAAQIDRLLRHPGEAGEQAIRAKEAMRPISWEAIRTHYLETLGLNLDGVAEVERPAATLIATAAAQPGQQLQV